MTDRPENLEPAPANFNAWLDATNDAGTTMLEVQLATFLDEHDPEMNAAVHSGQVGFAAEGPDPDGVYAVTFTRKDTGERLATLDIHWSTLAGEPPSVS